MENIFIEETKYTPEIRLDAQKGEIYFKGKSYPENTFEFYTPILTWIEEYFTKDVQNKTVINMEIIYFNSSSSKLFFIFLILLMKAAKTMTEETKNQ